MSKKIEKIIIGHSDYTREQMRAGISGWGITSQKYLEVISHYEEDGYEVKFETNLFRRIFGIGKYRVTGYKEEE